MRRTCRKDLIGAAKLKVLSGPLQKKFADPWSRIKGKKEKREILTITLVKDRHLCIQ